MSQEAHPDFMAQHGSVLITAIAGFVTTLVAFIGGRNNSTASLLKELTEGHARLNAQQNEKIEALEHEINLLRAAHESDKSELNGRIDGLLQRNRSLETLLRTHGIDIPQDRPQPAVVFLPKPDPKDPA